jgi:hypothetical protein
MGDRCFCTLTVIGQTDAETWKKIKTLIDDELYPEEEFEEGHFGVQDVNYATLPGTICDALIAAKLSYIWESEAGHEYGPEYELYNATNRAFASYCRSDFHITLSLEEAEDPEARAQARVWQEWIGKNGGLTIGS